MTDRAVFRGSGGREESGGTHFPCLDAYRGVGMLMVLLSHASFSTGNTSSALGPYLTRLELAVPMFFVLSGFLLWRPYALAGFTNGRLLDARRFLRRRALRIFPGYWAALAGIVLLFGARNLTDIRSWLVDLLLLQQFGVEQPYRITQAWSIGVELSFYLLLPLVGWAVLRSGSPRAGRPLAACLGFIATGWLFRVLVVATAPAPGELRELLARGEIPWQAQSLNWLPMYIDFFGIGMLLALASAAHQVGRPLPRVLPVLAEHPGACWVFAASVVILVAQMDPPDSPFGLNGLEYLPRQAAYSVASAVWLIPAMFGDQRRGRLRALLASHTLTWLGAISLSFYLWHLDLIHQAQRWTVEGYESRAGLAAFSGNFWLVSGIAIVTTLAIAAVLHRFVELPFLRLKDRSLRELPQVWAESLPRPTSRSNA